MRAYSTRGAARLVSVLTGLALLATVPIALADGASRPRSQAAELRAGAASLDKRASNATLELYALETELRRAQGDLDALAARRAQVARDRAATELQLEIAKQAVLSSESQLAVLVRALYERPDQADPLAVLLSAESLDEALAGLDSLSRVAGENNRIIEQARGTRTKLAALGARLAEQEDELNRLAAAAEQHAAELAATAAARTSFVTELRQRQGLTAARLAAVEAEAETAEKRTASMPAPAHAAGRDRGERTANDHRHGDWVHAARAHIDRDPDRARRRRRRSLRDPARNAADDSGLWHGRRGRHGRSNARKRDRSLVPDDAAGARVGAANSDRHDPVTRMRVE